MIRRAALRPLWEVRSMRALLSFVSVSLALAGSSARAQDFNIDIGPATPFGVPSSAYGAAANRAGQWIGVSAAGPLTDIQGALTNVTLTGPFYQLYSYDDPGPQGDDERLMNDAQTFGLGAGGTYTFSGLANGNYVLYTYAWSPGCSYCATEVDPLPGGGIVDPGQLVGGNWVGQQMLGVTYARQRCVVTNNTLAVSVGTYFVSGAVNGFQLEKLDTPAVAFCAGDGSGAACPCGNVGAPGNGCANSVNGVGALLGAAGIASRTYDSFVLDGSGMTSGTALYFQGTAQVNGGAGAAFGDGLRCAGGMVLRLGAKQNSIAGSSQYPDAGDAPISLRGQIPSAGGTYFYQCLYRNLSGACGSGFNLTNAVRVTWVP